MADSRRCPQCSAELPADAPEGVCPKCLLELGLATEGGSRPGTEPAATTPWGSRFVPPTPEQLAEHFPKLEILELAGIGGMGAVYKARQPGLDRLVALKILPPEVGRDPAFAERFAREARALAKLSHPNIVVVHDSGQLGGFYYFVMEFVEGTNLRQMIRAGQLEPEEAMAIVPQICQALQYAHDEGIVHRDIKPENILLDSKGRVKIADFGLAKLLGKTAADFTLTGTGQVMGTPHYMAPEQIEKPQEVDHRADIYSLGVVFYELLTGELPIGRFAPPSKKVQVDVRLDEIVLRALENEPEQRYQNVSDVKTDIEMMAGTPQPASAGGSAAEPADAVDLELIYRQVKSPATCLVMIGILHGIATVTATGFLVLSRVPLAPPDPVAILPGPVLMFFVFSGLLIFGALKMRRLEAYGAAITSSILAIIAGPATVVGLLVGIWALVVLSRKEVRAAFLEKRKHDKPATDAEAHHAAELSTIEGPADGLIVMAGVALLTAIGVAFWLGFAAFGWDPEASRHSAQARLQLELVSMAVTLAVYALVIATAGIQMRRLRGRLYALLCTVIAGVFVPAVLALNVIMEHTNMTRGIWMVMIPIWLGVPVAVWSIIVLYRRDVRASFKQALRIRREAPGSGKPLEAQGLQTAGDRGNLGSLRIGCPGAFGDR